MGYRPLLAGRRPYTETRPGEHAGPGQRGFTLLELTVSLLVTVEVMIGALLIFDFNNKLARVQTQITDMQQSLRVGQHEIVRTVRKAGRGGLLDTVPATPFPRGVAVEIRDNVGRAGVPDEVAIGFADIKAVPDTDIVTVRGAFNAPLYQVNSAVNTAFTLFDADGDETTRPEEAVRGTVHVCNKSPIGIAQDTAPLERAKAEDVPEALVLVSQLDDRSYGVVELDPAATRLASPLCAVAGDPDSRGVEVAFRVVGGDFTSFYQRLAPVRVGVDGAPLENLPPTLTRVSFVGLLEEYRFYVRRDLAVPGDEASAVSQRLSRARMFPGTETPYRDDPANLRIDIADNILDLQAALGLDTDNDGKVEADDDAAVDEWWNDQPGEDAADPRWRTVVTTPPTLPPLSTNLYYLRVSTVARTGRRDPEYQAPLLPQIENHSYVSHPANTDRTERMFRRRILQTVVDLRNI